MHLLCNCHKVIAYRHAVYSINTTGISYMYAIFLKMKHFWPVYICMVVFDRKVDLGGQRSY